MRIKSRQFFAFLCVFSLCALCVKKSFNRKARKEELRKERKGKANLFLLLIRIIYEGADVMTKATDNQTAGEFEIDAFADNYEALSDSFIDIKKASDSLKAHIGKGDKIFEIGLGTGYFASQFHYDGYTISGIQPNDKLLPRLRDKHPTLTVEAEEYLGDYVFEKKYDVIISHSSVFLFTKLELPFVTGETQTMLVFQSFIKDKSQVFDGVEKVMKALSPGGRFFINIQTNPKRTVKIKDNFMFEMLLCQYDFDRERVEKVFRTTYEAEIHPSRDVYYALRYSDFKRIMEEKGYHTSIIEDREWVVLSGASRA